MSVNNVNFVHIMYKTSHIPNFQCYEILVKFAYGPWSSGYFCHMPDGCSRITS